MKLDKIKSVLKTRHFWKILRYETPEKRFMARYARYLRNGVANTADPKILR
jgi:hypothetical protein